MKQQNSVLYKLLNIQYVYLDYSVPFPSKIDL